MNQIVHKHLVERCNCQLLRLVALHSAARNTDNGGQGQGIVERHSDVFPASDAVPRRRGLAFSGLRFRHGGEGTRGDHEIQGPWFWKPGGATVGGVATESRINSDGAIVVMRGKQLPGGATTRAKCWIAATVRATMTYVSRVKGGGYGHIRSTERGVASGAEDGASASEATGVTEDMVVQV